MLRTEPARSATRAISRTPVNPSHTFVVAGTGDLLPRAATFPTRTS